MRKLALSDEILLSVENPARYIGNEFNARIKDKNTIGIRAALCFPDVYEIGMSHLGLQILYAILNDMDDVWCERVYSPWMDLDKILREKNIPLFALESQDTLAEFDILGFTLQYEMCYTNVLQILELAKIPIFSKDRTEDSPIILGGGPCAINPQPLADFFDLFYIGEGEVSLPALMDCMRSKMSKGWDRLTFLKEAAKIEGIYAPALYTEKYDDSGALIGQFARYADVPETIRRVFAGDIDEIDYPIKPVVPFVKVTQCRAVLEIMRGCARACRFCQAGHICRPLREKDAKSLLETAKQLLDHTGFDEISLSSLSSSDYSELDTLTKELLAYASEQKINVSLPSLRVDSLSVEIMSKIQDVRKSSVTIAPEAGSQRLRDCINKGLTTEDILAGVRHSFLCGWERVKLYFMLGLPGETDEDIEAIAELAESIAVLFYETVPKESRRGKAQIGVSASFFVPKPFTPFQWAPQISADGFLTKSNHLRKAIMRQHNQRSISFSWHEADTAVLESALARGDRRMGKVIYGAYQRGSVFDSWNESFHKENWEQAFAENNLSLEYFAARQRDLDEVLPWDFIDVGVTKQHLQNEWQKAMANDPGTNCFQQCLACGIQTVYPCKTVR